MEQATSPWQRHEDHQWARLYRRVPVINGDYRIVAVHDKERNLTYLSEVYDSLSPAQQAATKRRTDTVVVDDISDITE